MSTKRSYRIAIKDRLFHNRYELGVSFKLDEVSCLKRLDHHHIDTMLSRRIHYREISLQRLVKSTVLTRRWKDITAETREHLHMLTQLLLDTQDPFKLVTSVESAWVYTNSVELVDQLSSLGFLRDIQYSRAIIDRPADTIKLKYPKHQYRGYFKSIKLQDIEKRQLENFFSNQTSIRVSPSMLEWFTQPYLRTQDYFFIDYDTEASLTMLALIRPGLIRKVVTIIPG